MVRTARRTSSAEESIDELFAAEWEVHYNSNRLGVRLIGPKPTWTRNDGGEAGLHPSNIHDCEYAVGSINFTGDSPVILTRDGPSLGGFVCPITIAKAELWKVGQVRPGDRIRFRRIGYEEAAALEALQERQIETLQDAPPFAPLPLPRQAEDCFGDSAGGAACDHHIALQVAYRQAGDNYVLLEYGENVLDLALRLRVHLLMEALQSAAHRGHRGTLTRRALIADPLRQPSHSTGPVAATADRHRAASGRRIDAAHSHAHRASADGVRRFRHSGRRATLQRDRAQVRALAAEQRRLHSAHQWTRDAG